MDRALEWDRGTLKLLDQSALPRETRVIVCATVEEVAEAIRSMKIRGAPAIGAALIRPGERILTYCNTGSLATVDYGTALGIIRTAHEQGKRIQVLVSETRPVLQGARLTAWEVLRDGIPATLIADNAAGWLMRRGLVGRGIVGAGRGAAQGGPAHKIGAH